MSRVRAKPSKLRDGTWGATTSGAVQVGDTITIESQGGKAWDAVVAKVIWSDDRGEKCLCQTRKPGEAPSSNPAQQPQPRRQSSGVRADYVPGWMSEWLDK